MKKKALVILVSMASLLFFYIIQVSSLTKAQYLIQNYQKKIAGLSKANEALEISFSQSNSLSNMDKYLAVQNYEKVGKVVYIRLAAGQVARK